MYTPGLPLTMGCDKLEEDRVNEPNLFGQQNYSDDGLRFCMNDLFTGTTGRFFRCRIRQWIGEGV